MSVYSTSSPEYEITWISSFCARRKNRFFCEVSESYISDPFNLVGLEKQVHHYAQALNVILNRSESDFDDTTEESELTTNVITKSAETLYGLIHARYILTIPGIAKMLRKYHDGDFGYCPRVYCNYQKMLPIGLSDIRGQRYAKVYCPKCMEVYKPRCCKHVDGAFFGTGFPHMFFMVLPEQRPKPPVQKFVLRLFGFQIQSRAHQLQEDE